MKLHANAALSLNKRRVLARRIVNEGWSLTKAAEAAEVSERTARKWARRFRLEGELLHIDVKKLGRIGSKGAGHRMTGRKHYTHTRTDREGRRRNTVGWEFCHVAVDDATRLAYVEVLGDERATTAVGFLKRALAFYRRHGVSVEAVMTDNGSAYRSTVHAIACRTHGIRHLRTQPRRPQTNGKAERFIRTMLGGWAYGAIYRSSNERAAALEGWLWRYEWTVLHRLVCTGFQTMLSDGVAFSETT